MKLRFSEYPILTRYKWEVLVMDYQLRLVVEKVAVSNQKVIKRDTIKIYDIKKPQSILDLGIRHQEQIAVLSKVENAF